MVEGLRLVVEGLRLVVEGLSLVVEGLIETFTSELWVDYYPSKATAINKF